MLTKEKFISYIPSWPNLANIGNNKLVVSSYIWIVVIPILAKFLEHLPHSLPININDNTIILGFTLPFEWKILYFSALLFALATLLYTIFCPNLIKNFSDMNHFKEKGLTKAQLISFLSTWLREGTTPYDGSGKEMKKEIFITTIYNKHCKETIRESIKSNNMNALVKTFQIKDNEEINAYWLIRAIMSNDRLIIRGLITLLYLIAFSLLFYLLVQNILCVVSI